MITIKQVTNKKKLRQFVTFPFKLYKNCSYWVPPLIKDEMETLDTDLNPVFKNAEASYHLAWKEGKIVGRVAVIINHIEIKEIGKKKVRFGWLDMIDDIEVTKALMQEVYEVGRAHNLEYAEGPMGFSNMEKAGILDPKKVTRCAIENASSIAGMLITVGCALVDKSSKLLDRNENDYKTELI